MSEHIPEAAVEATDRAPRGPSPIRAMPPDFGGNANGHRLNCKCWTCRPQDRRDPLEGQP
jgi:hypothetical protein